MVPIFYDFNPDTKNGNFWEKVEWLSFTKEATERTYQHIKAVG
jgi:hypothetical protein